MNGQPSDEENVKSILTIVILSLAILSEILGFTKTYHGVAHAFYKVLMNYLSNNIDSSTCSNSPSSSTSSNSNVS
jgi:hypothetical protein